MGKAYYVKFETPEDLVSPILEAVRVASTSGKVKKGTNEATKAIERGTSTVSYTHLTLPTILLV